MIVKILTSKVFCCGNFVKYPISFPPPVVLGLGELSLSVVAVDVGPVGVIAGYFQGSDKINQMLLINVIFRNFSHLPFFFDVPGTVIRGLSWKLLFVSLEGQGVEYLQCHAKVY